MKSDEPILVDSDFVQRVLKSADESLESKYRLKSEGYDLDELARKVGEIFSIKPTEIFLYGKQRVRVMARSLLCYWAVKELGYSMTELGKKLNLTQPAVSLSVQSGQGIADENEYLLTNDRNL